MRVCIIGAGWYGCHAAMFLRARGIEVRMFDREGIFAGSSSKNQNRLHLGYHYPRSPETVHECKQGYSKFIESYGFCVSRIPKNLYLLHKESRTSFEEYQKLFNGHQMVSHDFKNVHETGMIVDECHIDNWTAKRFFEKELSGILEYKEASAIDTSVYDMVLNCTNNQWVVTSMSPTYECFCSLLYRIEFDEITALTVMDGPFFSIFPYDIENKLYTVTHVQHGVIYRGNVPSLCEPDIDKLRSSIEPHIKTVYPDFTIQAKYHGYFLSSKTKYDFTTDDRSLRWSKNENVYSFSGGKITGIFEMEKILEQICQCSQTTEKDEPSLAKSDPSTLTATPRSLDSPATLLG